MALTSERSLYLDGVQLTGTELGAGSYGSVVELDYGGLKCAGKRMYPLLLEHEHGHHITMRFFQECQLLSKMRHPNIVNFFGLIPVARSNLPIQVFEFLPTDLGRCIEQYGVLPMEISCSILHNVSLGLNYLHNQTPPIMHRDLSAKNIFLSSDMTAKISDLMMAKPYDRYAREMTELPGTLAYMPPEACVQDPKYDTTIDVFSFGVIMIYIFSGEFPMPTEAVRTNPEGKLIPVSEAERREKYLRTIGDDHPLMDLILKCINNHPPRRGTAAEIVQRLKDAVVRFPPSYANKVEMLNRIKSLEEENRDLTAKIEKEKNDARGIAQELRGVEVCAETTVTVTNSSQHFHWKGYGLTLHFPDGCLPVDVDECSITIMASLAGQYEFPADSHLVSAVFWLRCEPMCKFTKAISVELEHCALKENTSKLSIVRSHCTQEKLPYAFKKLGGSFIEQSSYGYIEVDSFSGLAITQHGSKEREYCAGLYYLEKTRLNPEIHFVIHWNTKAQLTHVRNQYKSEGAVRGPDTGMNFKADAISLDIPPQGAIVSGGWTLLRLTAPIITKESVDSFRSGRRIPHCEMQAMHPPPTATDDSMPVLTHELHLQGARQPFDSLTISFIPSSIVNPGARTLHSTEKPLLKDLLKELNRVADRWELIGVFLDMDDGQLKTVKANNTLVEDRLLEMLRLWLKRVSPPPSWAAVVKAIDSLGTEPALALELREKYILP